MKPLGSILVAVLLAAADCGEQVADFETGRARTAEAPVVGAKSDGGGDSVDRSCRVVLRNVYREPATHGSDYETDCTSGRCLYLWRGRVDLADGLSPEDVFVLYHLEGDPSWYKLAASPCDDTTAGFSGMCFAVSEHLFGPGDEPQPVELVAYARLEDGTRLFDHNVHPGDFENTILDTGNGFSSFAGEQVCRPEVGHLWFNADWSVNANGALRQGGYLQVRYALERLPRCRGTHNGYPAWDIVAHAMFGPGSEHFSSSVRRNLTENGTPTNQVVPVPFTVPVPDGAEWVELWFENYTGAGSSCHDWDSNYGENFRFEVWPTADDPRCLNIERDNPELHGEDYRMPHNEPYCLGYEVAENHDASYCEFQLEGLGRAHVGHYGIPFDWLLAYLRTGEIAGEVLAAGMFVRYHDSADGSPGVRFTLGVEESPGLWRVGFGTQDARFPGSDGYLFEVDEFAFYIDVRRADGTVVRLWQSRGGANYTPADAFSMPTSTEYIPYGNIQWADYASPVFDSRRACGG